MAELLGLERKKNLNLSGTVKFQNCFKNILKICMYLYIANFIKPYRDPVQFCKSVKFYETDCSKMASIYEM